MPTSHGKNQIKHNRNRCHHPLITQLNSYVKFCSCSKKDLFFQTSAKESGKPWDLSKGFDNSAPISKIQQKEGFLLTEGNISLRVNGQKKQSSNLVNMAWKVDELISWLSKIITLKAGDAIFTGTPSGVSRLSLNDKIEAEIENIGSLSFELVQ